MDRIVLVMSGIPGSGKSTLAKHLKPLLEEQGYFVVVCSADDYHVNKDGEYVFKPENLPKAHTACLGKFLKCLEDASGMLAKKHCIVVDNTSLHNWERAPYMALATLYGFEARIVQLTVPAAIAAERNIHGVPFDRIDRMTREDVLPWWKEIIIPGRRSPEQAAALLLLQILERSQG